jgi:hypothetical protein
LTNPLELSIEEPGPGDAALTSRRRLIYGRYRSRSPQPDAAIHVSVDGERIAPVVLQSAMDAPPRDGLHTHHFVAHLHAFLDKFDGAKHEVVVEASARGRTETRRFAVLFRRDSFLSLASVDTTNSCNLRCRFCNEDQNWKLVVMERGEFDRLGAELFPAVSETILLSCGDEPFMNKRFHRYCESLPAAEQSKSFFTSNMTVPLSDEQIEAIAGCRLQSINVSLDSSDPRIFESMRARGRFDVFVDNVTRLARALDAKRNRILRFIAVITRQNFRTLPDTLLWAMRFDPAGFELRTLSFSHHWAEAGWRIAEGTMAPEELDWLRLEVDEICRAHGTPYVFEPASAGTPEGYADPDVFPTRLPLKDPILPPSSPRERRARFEEENRQRLELVSRLGAEEADLLLETNWARVIATGRVVFNNRFPAGYLGDHEHLGESAFEHACAISRRLRELSRRD